MKSQPRRTNDMEPGSSLKRAMDIVGSVLALIMLFPIFVVIAIAIKLTSKGPVLFRQQRIGQHGRPFVFLKFRSMCVANDPHVHKEYIRRLIAGAAERNPSGGDGRKLFKLTRDPHITPLGAFLRQTGLDELPQFINVLSGNMSLCDLWDRSGSAPPSDPPSLGSPHATICAPLRPKPAPRSGAISRANR